MTLKYINKNIIDFERLETDLNRIALSAGLPKSTQSIIKRIKREEAFLLSSGQGFVIIQSVTQDGEKICIVLAAYSIEEDSFVKYEPQVEHFARSLGCEYLDFWTHRKGFSRLAPKRGYKQQFTVWRKPIEN